MASDTRPASIALGSRLAERLQMAANIAVILACVGVGWAVWLRTHLPVPDPPPMYEVGEQMGPIAGVDFHASPQTLVMVLREDCGYCRESLPFYRNLTAAVGKTATRALRVFLASTDPPAAMATYLKASEIQVDQVAGVRPGELKVPGTPFLMLVDGNGIVTRTWRGRLGDRQEQEVFKVLGLGAID